MSTTQPLTPAERAAAEALARHFNENYSDGIERHGVANWTPEARAVVAAVRPSLAAEFRDSLFQQAAELPGADEDDPEAEARNAAADRLLALAPEQATPDAKDAFWRAAAITRSNPLSRPA